MTAPALTIIMTTAGLARFTAAQIGQPVDLTVSTIALTNAAFVVSPTLTALPGEFRRLDSLSGRAVGDNVVHLIMRDDDPAAAYSARGFGLFLEDGTLFAVYGQEEQLFSKSSQSSFMAAIDLAFPTPDIDRLSFGDTSFLNPPATTTQPGVVELATQAEGNAGTDTRRVPPVSVVTKLIAAAVDGLNQIISEVAVRAADYTDELSTFVTKGAGLVTGSGRNNEERVLTVEAATAVDVRAGTADDCAVTPAALGGAGAVYVVEQKLDLNGYRRWSDGLKECWGAVAVPASSTVTVALPIAHTAWCVPTGTSSIAQDEQSCGALNVTAAGFDVRNRNPLPTTFFWHTKGR